MNIVFLDFIFYVFLILDLPDVTKSGKNCFVKMGNCGCSKVFFSPPFFHFSAQYYKSSFLSQLSTFIIVDLENLPEKLDQKADYIAKLKVACKMS